MKRAKGISFNGTTTASKRQVVVSLCDAFVSCVSRFQSYLQRVKVVMVILTYSTSKNYGVDVAVSHRLFVVCAPYVYFRLVPVV